MNSGGQNPCSVMTFYEVFTICFKVGKTSYEGRFEDHFSGRIIPFGATN